MELQPYREHMIIKYRAGKVPHERGSSFSGSVARLQYDLNDATG